MVRITASCGRRLTVTAVSRIAQSPRVGARGVGVLVGAASRGVTALAALSVSWCGSMTSIAWDNSGSDDAKECQCDKRWSNTHDEVGGWAR